MAESFNGTTDLLDLVDEETRPLDVVASWESLCDTYRTLEFSDEISDQARIEEYKWIIQQMNAHLSRARKKLMSCKDTDSAMEVLENMFTPSGKVNLTGRMDLAYQKLRQRWVMRMLNQMEMLEAKEQMENGEQDGEPDWQ